MQVNLTGRLNNIPLPVSKALLPLFEAVVNSIHAIEDAKINDGFIKIFIQRGNIQTGLIDDSNFSPIEGFKIVDNGIGFNDENYQSFTTSDSIFKQSRGGKGVGRFLWLKAFSLVSIASFYEIDNVLHERSFDFSAGQQGVSNLQERKVKVNELVEQSRQETTVCLKGFQQPYRENCPQDYKKIATRILEHYLTYFLLDSAPQIEVIDGDEVINLNDYFSEQIKLLSEVCNFEINTQKFELRSIKFYEGESSEHKFFLCANKREVSSEKLNKYILDLGTRKLKDKINRNKYFTYLGYISSPYLDRQVTSERTRFNLFDEPNELSQKLGDVSKKELRDNIIYIIETQLSSYLEDIRRNKEEEIRKYVTKEAPEYRPLLKYASDKFREIPPGLAEEKLDLELHKQLASYELSLKAEGKKILSHPLSDFKKYPEYRKKYYNFLEQYNDLGKSKLAEYIVHRKIILEIFSTNLEKDEGGKYKLEKDIHKIIFPLQETSDDVEFEKQNLWIIDERLSYHQYLASDKALNKLEAISVDGDQRPDLVIFNNPIAFVEGEQYPYSSVVIIEFKRPMRAIYSDDENPIDQVLNYMRKIKSGSYEDKNGRPITLPDNIPLYGYIICDLTKKIKEMAENAGYIETPDLQGYFGYNPKLKAYIEIISFEKLIQDANKRNNILFKKLHLS